MMAKALAKMESAGFKIEVLPDRRLNVKGKQSLTEPQKQWIIQNKPSLVDYLLAMQDQNIRNLVEQFDAKIITRPEVEAI